MRRNIAIVLLIILGCGPREAAPVSVRGVVTLDGKPLPDGQISFITLGKVPNVIPIMDGRFEGEVPPGAKRVEIAAYCPAEITPDQLLGRPPSPGATVKNYLPVCYHAQSTLTATIGDTPMDLEFSLTLKP